jgi:hypothetical protein
MFMGQELFNISVGIAGALGGWWMRVMWEALRELEKADRALVDRVAAIDLLVAGQYVRRDYFESRMHDLSTALLTKLDRIENKLDLKVDKGRP